MVLQTERHILDTWQVSDWIALRPIATDTEVMHYITGGMPWTEDKIQSFVKGEIARYSEHGFCRWKMLEKSSGEMIGFCGVGFWRDAPDPEIGWWLARRCWGRGLATEAARSALQDVFERLCIERIISIARPANIASTRIMQKLELEFECEFENDGLRLVRYATDRQRYFSSRDREARSGALGNHHLG